MIDYRIRADNRFSEKMGVLVSMLEHTRAVTLQDVSNLSQSDLDYLPDGSSNSIGALLLHIASIEFVHQVITVENRDINDKERLKWETALELGDRARREIKEMPLDYYLNVLATTRRKTLLLLESKDDHWLFEDMKWEWDSIQ